MKTTTHETGQFDEWNIETYNTLYTHHNWRQIEIERYKIDIKIPVKISENNIATTTAPRREKKRNQRMTEWTLKRLRATPTSKMLCLFNILNEWHRNAPTEIIGSVIIIAIWKCYFLCAVRACLIENRI